MAKKETGWDCDQINPDGSRTCRRIMKDKKGNQKLRTGTEITIGVDPDTCDPVFSGDTQTIMDEDDGAITEIANKVTSQCRKEKGL